MNPSRMVRSSRRLLRLTTAIRNAARDSAGLASPTDRALWQQRHAIAMLRAMEIEVEVRGDWPRSGLLVANHLGYLDILVIASHLPCVFVSKSEVRSWPFIGNLLGAAGTILANRDSPQSARETIQDIRQSLESGIPVVVFPEGTSSDGSTVLPFRSSLLESVAGSDWPVHPLAISYLGSGGNTGRDICYWGDDTFLPHLIRLAGIDPILATVAVGPGQESRPSRKDAAAHLRFEVIRLLDGIREYHASGLSSLPPRGTGM